MGSVQRACGDYWDELQRDSGKRKCGGEWGADICRECDDDGRGNADGESEDGKRKREKRRKWRACTIYVFRFWNGVAQATETRNTVDRSCSSGGVCAGDYGVVRRGRMHGDRSGGHAAGDVYERGDGDGDIWSGDNGGDKDCGAHVDCAIGKPRDIKAQRAGSKAGSR